MLMSVCATSWTSTSGSAATQARSNARPSSRRAPLATKITAAAITSTPSSSVNERVSTWTSARRPRLGLTATPSQIADTSQRSCVATRRIAIAASRSLPERPAFVRSPASISASRGRVIARPDPAEQRSLLDRLLRWEVSLRACATTADGTPLLRTIAAGPSPAGTGAGASPR